MAIWEEVKAGEDAYSTFNFEKFKQDKTNFSREQIDNILKYLRFKAKVGKLTPQDKEIKKAIRSYKSPKKFPFAFNEMVKPQAGTKKKHEVIAGKDFVFQISEKSPRFLECFASRRALKEQKTKQSARVLFRLDRGALKEMAETLNRINQSWDSYFKG